MPKYVLSVVALILAFGSSGAVPPATPVGSDAESVLDFSSPRFGPVAEPNG